MTRQKTNKWLKIGLLLGLMLFISACGRTDQPLTPESQGFWDQYILLNLSRLLMWISNLFGGNFGVGIIIFTILIRILLLPLSKMQMDSQREIQALQPELEAIKEKYPNQDKASREAMQLEQQALMEDRGVNQLAGCLPLLVQLPILTALYQAIMRTPELHEGSFLWLKLSNPDPFFILPVIAAGLTYWSLYLTQLSQPVKPAASKVMNWIMPGFILLIMLGLPSAIGLYMVTTNAFNVVQTLIFNNPYKIIEEREAIEAENKAQERALKRAVRRAKRK